MTNLIFKKQTIFFLISLILTISSCKKDKIEKQNVQETITKLELTFKDPDGKVITVISDDPDGDGTQTRKTGVIELSSGKKYSLTVKLYNGLLKPGEDGYDVSEEVAKEAEEHQFFFVWTAGLFTSPAGDGNVDISSDPLNYEDKDKNNLPIGLKTNWTTGAAAKGTWRIMLKHQPDLKNDKSTAATGESDLDVTFDINIK